MKGKFLGTCCPHFWHREVIARAQETLVRNLLSVHWNPAWFFSSQSRLVTLSHVVHSRSPSPAGCSPLQLAKTFIGLLTVFVSPSLLSISVYFILSFRMKAVNLNTASALNGFLIINLKLSYKLRWEERISEARCRITGCTLKNTPNLSKIFSLRKYFSSWLLLSSRLLILWFLMINTGIFWLLCFSLDSKETALQSCSANYSYVWQWCWEAATVQKSPLLLCTVPAHKIW